MGDADDVIAEAEREQQLGRVGDEAHDPHDEGNDMGRLTDDEIDEALRALPEWRREGDAIVRDLELPDFAAALAYVNAAAAVAEERDHHPDLLLHGWNRVRVTISTHSEGGITALDVGLADALPAPG